MAREIHLDGGEITVLKAVGLSGARIKGRTLVERLENMGVAELIDTLDSLMMFGHLEATTERFSSIHDVETADFWVNSGRLKELREAISGRDDKPERRRRRG